MFAIFRVEQHSNVVLVSRIPIAGSHLTQDVVLNGLSDAGSGQPQLSKPLPVGYDQALHLAGLPSDVHIGYAGNPSHDPGHLLGQAVSRVQVVSSQIHAEPVVATAHDPNQEIAASGTHLEVSAGQLGELWTDGRCDPVQGPFPLGDGHQCDLQGALVRRSRSP